MGRRLQAWLATSSAWGRRLLALAGGLASVLAMAPFFMWPVLALTLPLLVILVDVAVARAPRRPLRHAASVGWWFGFGYFIAGLFWIGEAFLVEAERFAMLMPFAVLAMPAGLALFWAAATAAAASVRRSGWRRVVALAVALSAAEWLRGHIFTGFPWNVLGYALTAPDTLMQSAALLGIYGLTLVAVLVLGLPGVLWHDAGLATSPEEAREGRRSAVRASIGAVAGLVLLYGFGAIRLALSPPGQAAEPVVDVRLVQPSIPQREKWQSENQRRNFERHLDLTRRNAAGEVDGARGRHLIVWPEAAMPFLPLDTPQALAAIGDVVPEGGHLMAGLLRIEPAAVPRGGRERRIFNSLAAFAPGGRPAAIYDKTHLVPFGEYLPFQETLEAIGLEQLTRIRGGFDVGPTPRPVLRLAGLPALAPLICYEAIFPRAVVSPAGRPAAFVNVTNDGWFGNTTGPRQHLHQARVRAVEEGIPVIRSANNGISAMIDAHGRIVARLELNVIGIADARLPVAASPPIYAWLGDGLFLVLAGLSVAAVASVGQHRH